MSSRATIDERLAAGLAAAGLEGFEVLVVLGSGLGAFGERLSGARSVPFAEVDGMPPSRVPGHAGRFVLGALDGVRVLVQQGRVHLYEGRSPHAVTATVRAAGRLGARALVLTNAAGGIDPAWPVPCLMRVTDHLSLQGVAPLSSGEEGRGSPYDPALGELMDGAAAAAGVALRAGVYAATLGPAYETPAEIRMLRRLGAAAVGMSTVAEASAGWTAGMRVAALSCIANAAAGVAQGPLRHEDVVAAGAAVAGELAAVLAGAVPRIGRT